MASGLLKSIRSQKKVPLETISAAGLIAAISLQQLTSGRPSIPFEVCGHVYATPPREIYLLVFVLSAISFSRPLIAVLRRYFVLRYLLGNDTRTAQLVPCVGSDIHNNRSALYVRNWSVLTSLGIYFVHSVLVTWYLGTRMKPPLLAFGFITALQLLNILLAIVRIVIPLQKASFVCKCIDLLSVLSTDKEYEAPNFIQEEWNPVTIDELPIHQAYEIIHNPHTIIDLDTGQSLCFRNDQNIGFRTSYLRPSWNALFFLRIPKGSFVQLDHQEFNFDLLPLRVPYSVMWYSTYHGLRLIGSYRGAGEIDKCLVWLGIVSFLAALFVAYTPGPCVVIKKATKDDHSA